MIILKLLKHLIKKHVDQITFPEFSDNELIRYSIIFTGKVQHVGFRDEIRFIAYRIGLTGYARNANKNMVITEIQGTQEKIDSLLFIIKNEKRFVLDDIKIEKLEVVKEDMEFKIIKK